MGKNKLQEDTKGMEGPEEKKRRSNISYPVRHLSAGEVDICMKHLHNESLVNVAFSSNSQSQSLQEVKHRIEGRGKVSIGAKQYLLYAAFEEALLKSVTQIEEVLSDKSNAIRIILIHGVPKIGKTALAKCLAYFLALYAGPEEKVNFLQLPQSAKIKDKVLTDRITDAFNDKYLIVDQVNTHSLIASEIMEYAENRFTVCKYRMPVIMFTSGHNAPNDEWLGFQKLKLLRYKIIAMEIDSLVVDELWMSMKIPEECVLSNNHLLRVTNCYSRMVLCVNHLRCIDSCLKEVALQELIYPSARLEEIKKESAVHFIQLAWCGFLSKGLLPKGEITDGDCEVKPHHVEYLGFLISDIKDKAHGINSILNQMDIAGPALYQQNGYSEFNPDSYCYKFLHKKSLYRVLASAVRTQAQLSPELKLQTLVEAFNRLRKTDNSSFIDVKCDLFKLLITCICEREASLRCNPVGMLYQSVLAGLDLIKVDESVDVATEIDLCNLPLERERCQLNRSTFWCVLNVPGKKPFEGYDFAYMVTRPLQNKPVVEKLQLFQVAINPEGKPLEKKMIMTDVLEKIKHELGERKLIKCSDADRIVVPYFVHPSAEHRQIDLPYRGYLREIVVDILGFPQKKFGIE